MEHFVSHMYSDLYQVCDSECFSKIGREKLYKVCTEKGCTCILIGFSMMKTNKLYMTVLFCIAMISSKVNLFNNCKFDYTRKYIYQQTKKVGRLYNLANPTNHNKFMVKISNGSI